MVPTMEGFEETTDEKKKLHAKIAEKRDRNEQHWKKRKRKKSSILVQF